MFATRGPRPSVSDGAFVFLGLALMGAPHVLGSHLNDTVQTWMFWGGLAGLVVYVGWRWGEWLFGLLRLSAEPTQATIDNRGGAYVGRDNTGTQQVFHGPVTFNSPQNERHGLNDPVPKAFDERRAQQYRLPLEGRVSDFRLSVGESGRYFSTKATHGLYGTRRTFNLKCENVDREKALTRCKLILLSITPQEYEGPWELKSDFDLAAGDHVYVPLVSYGESRSESRSWNSGESFMEAFPIKPGSPKPSKDGVHTFAIRATSVDTAHEDFECKVWVDENGHLRIEDASEASSRTVAPIYVPLQEAARRVYEVAERDDWLDVVLSDRSRPEDRLSVFITMFLIEAGNEIVELRGKRPPSTRLRPIPAAHAKRLHLPEGEKADRLFEIVPMNQIAYEDVVISESDLLKVAAIYSGSAKRGVD